MHKKFLLFALLSIIMSFAVAGQKKDKTSHPKMMFGDTSRIGVPFAKDPFVIKFKGKYLMYYSIPPYKDKANPVQGWGLGIAESKDLNHWKKIGEVTPDGEYEKKGLAAPSAIVIDNQVNLFYQTYGNGPKDAICHAFSTDGIQFTRNATNPIFHPTGTWNCGRAIDAEIFKYKDKFMLYFATRDPDYKIQIQGVASAPANAGFNRDQWTQLTDAPILKPEYPWEGDCIEAAALVQKGDLLYMFYAGAYNNDPQQIGVARSSNGVKWEKLSNKPFLTNGDPGEWNYSESGHPHLFKDEDGRTYLFFQGNNDKGKTWYLSNTEVFWNEKGPTLKKK